MPIATRVWWSDYWAQLEGEQCGSICNDVRREYRTAQKMLLRAELHLTPNENLFQYVPWRTAMTGRRHAIVQSNEGFFRTKSG